MRIGFLGLGPMGSAVAELLLESGYEVTVWNRSPAAARALGDKGAAVADSSAQAAVDAQVVFTMLHDDDAVRSVLRDGGVLDHLPAGAVHVSLSTISPALSAQLAAEHSRRGQRYLASPVFGRPHLAAEGKLWLVLGGPEALVEELLPVLQRFSRGYTVAGSEPPMANAVKLAGNFLITATIASFSEAFNVAEAGGVDPAIFLEAINSALLQSPFIANYGNVMLHPPEKVTVPVTLGEKDNRLFREAAETSVTPTPLADHFAKLFRTAIENGRGGDDWAAGLYTSIREQGRKH